MLAPVLLSVVAINGLAASEPMAARHVADHQSEYSIARFSDDAHDMTGDPRVGLSAKAELCRTP